MSSSSRHRLCDKKIKIAESKVLKILYRIDNWKLNDSYVTNLSLHGINKKSDLFGGKFKYLTVKVKKIFYCLLLPVALWFLWWIYNEVTKKSCLLELPSSSKTFFRPPEDCSMCKGLKDVVRVSNISSIDFENEYAYSTTPVIVTDAAAGWKAYKEFNFDFFSNFYKNGKMGKQTNDCFFFSYKSGLNSLQEVFDMDERRANLSGAPWYVGWSTCYDEETRSLRDYYNRPYFLPKNAESDMIDWIFMGGPGQGAHMHVDSVRHMSWQAQISGRKEWELAPPPECLYHCQWITFTVTPGDILVVNTNRWYHKTNVLPGDISITIGAEYD